MLKDYASVLLMGVFEEFPQGRNLWRYDKQEFHSFFAAEQENHLDLLSNIVFYNRSDGKHSPSLEQALTNLRAMGCLKSWGSGFNPQEYFKSKYAKEQVSEVFTDSSELKELSGKFQEKFYVSF